MCFPPPLCGVSNRGRWHAVPEGKSERIFMSLFRCDVQFERSIGRISATDSPLLRVEVVGSVAKMFCPAEGKSFIGDKYISSG